MGFAVLKRRSDREDESSHHETLVSRIENTKAEGLTVVGEKQWQSRAKPSNTPN